LIQETQTARERLLAATVGYVAEHGVVDLSLRRLATAIGSSHRMLIYHFRSKEGLLVEVVREAERRQRETLDSLLAGADGSLGDLIRQTWQRLADPALWSHERVFFELYGQVLRGRAGNPEMLTGMVESWIDHTTKVIERAGVSPGFTRAQARLIVAVVLGLLLDLLATGDRPAADQALECFIAQYP